MPLTSKIRDSAYRAFLVRLKADGRVPAKFKTIIDRSPGRPSDSADPITSQCPWLRLTLGVERERDAAHGSTLIREIRLPITVEIVVAGQDQEELIRFWEIVAEQVRPRSEAALDTFDAALKTAGLSDIVIRQPLRIVPEGSPGFRGGMVSGQATLEIQLYDDGKA